MDITLPQLGENVSSADVSKLLVHEGDTVTEGQSVLELEASKAIIEIPAPAAGVISRIAVKEGDHVSVGQTLMSVGDAVPDQAPPPTEAASPPKPAEKKGATPAAPSPPSTSTPNAAGVPAAPSVRRLARELGVELTSVKGSGPHGRVSADDVRSQQPSRPATAPTVDIPALPDFAAWGPVHQESMTHIRHATAQQVARCWDQVVHVTHFDEVDITELEALRKRYADRADKLGGKLTMAVMVVKIAASALRVFPKFNASIDMASRTIIYKDYVNIGIAVSTERGLLVPVLRDVDRKNMVQIAAEVSAIAVKARKGSVSMNDLQGGTFTVTNLGNIGGTHFTPIVNWPEVAILGMGRARNAPAFEKDVCKPKVYLPLSLSYDHRLIDGAEAARFVQWIVDAIQEPLLLSLEG